jgi:hypothetical protein
MVCCSVALSFNLPGYFSAIEYQSEYEFPFGEQRLPGVSRTTGGMSAQSEEENP